MTDAESEVLRAWVAQKLEDPDWVAKIRARGDEADKLMREHWVCCD